MLVLSVSVMFKEDKTSDENGALDVSTIHAIVREVGIYKVQQKNC